MRVYFFPPFAFPEDAVQVGPGFFGTPPVILFQLFLKLLLLPGADASGEQVQHHPAGGKAQHVDSGHRQFIDAQKAPDDREVDRDPADDLVIADRVDVFLFIGVALGDEFAVEIMVFHHTVGNDRLVAAEGNDIAGLERLGGDGVNIDETADRDGRLHASGFHMIGFDPEDAGEGQGQADSDHQQQEKGPDDIAEGGKEFPALFFRPLAGRRFLTHRSCSCCVCCGSFRYRNRRPPLRPRRR